MKVEVDKDVCEGHALCTVEAPEVFSVGDDGKVELLDSSPEESLRTAVHTAALTCPTRAIRVS